MAWVLAVDVGNTVTRLAALRGGEVVAVGRLPTAGRDRSALVTRLRDRLLAWLGGAPQVVGIGCVVPAVLEPLRQGLAHLDVPVVTVGPGNQAGLMSAYQPPDALGSDRIANAVAARQRFGAPCIAVDLGTALSFEVVDGDGVLRGGLLFPGVHAAMAALGEATALLGPAAAGSAASVIGSSTGDGIAAGVGWGYPALIDGLLGRIREELGSPAPAVLTGGGVRHLVGAPQAVQARDAHLTLRGIAAIAHAAGSQDSPREGA
jgi:type III pantothenate kinase